MENITIFPPDLNNYSLSDLPEIGTLETIEKILNKE
ncbi:hypothetical protein cce_2416 [Crocosphaera subtropica ATCC 51142]|uniref:Uncharacterized protein n=1 Tax=Crocosphaera subtropica (strain ATCC 51142 / BH68) TaxID=43989 RepID=B1WRB5_CROS5|nr:hypothetical protein cce_2416 [Crocosphaera subtropica ATCC 51142]